MRGNVSADHTAIKRCIQVVANFGFISRSIFEDELVVASRVHRWRVWQKILSTGYFRSYRDAFLKDDVITFSKTAIMRLDKSIKPVKPIPVQNLSHDEHVMRFALHNENKMLIENIQTEAMLKRDNNVRFSIGHKDRKIKYPDLLFSLAVPGKHIQVAFECERTRKAFQAYRAFLIAYAGLPGIDFVIVACQSKAIVTALKESMRLMNYPAKERPIAFCLIDEVMANPSNFGLDLNGSLTSLRSIVQNLKAKTASVA